MKRIIQKTLDDLIKMGWITLNQNILPGAVAATIAEKLKDITVKEFLEKNFRD